MLGALRSQTGLGPAHIRKQVTRLHGRNHFEILETLDLLQSGDLRVLDAKPVIIVTATIGRLHLGVFCRLLRLGKGVERQLHPFVADGVKTDLISGQHALFRHRIQLGRVVLRQSAVLRVIAEGIKHRGGFRAERTIHEALQHSGVEHRVGHGMRVALLVQLFNRVVKR